MSHHKDREIYIENVLTESIKDRFTVQAPNTKITNFVSINEFSEKYQKLLENQHKQLASI